MKIYPDFKRYHCFEFLDKFFILDIANSCLYELSEEAYTAYNDFLNKEIEPSDELLEQLNQIFSSPTFPEDKSVLTKLEKEIPKQNLLWLGVTHCCNLRCSYCFVDLNQSIKQNMDFETAKAGIDRLIADSGDSKELTVIFFGGEPLLRIDLLSEIVNYCNAKGHEIKKDFKYNVTTNGLLLTPHVFKILEELNIAVMVSLDGDQEAHDSLRKTPTGEPSWNKIIGNLALIPDFGKKIAVRITITYESPDYLRIYQNIEKLGFESIFITEVCPGPKNSENLRQNLVVLKENYQKLMEYLFEQAIQNGNVALAKLHRFLDALYSGSKSYYGCATGLNGFYLTPDGDYFPCNRMVTPDQKFKIGNVKQGYDKSKQQIFINNHIFNKPCRDCWARFICGGQCYADSYWATNDILKPDPFSCEMIRFKIVCAAYFLSRLYALKEDCV